MIWIAGSPSDGMCYHQHTLPSLPSMLHIPSVVTNITPFHKGHLAILLLLAILPSSTIHIAFAYQELLCDHVCHLLDWKSYTLYAVCYTSSDKKTIYMQLGKWKLILTLKRPPLALGCRRPPGVKCDPTMKMVITNADF
jgi:hypothetical protein